MADDIITAEEREEWKRIFEHAETSKLIGWKTDWQLALEDKAQDGWPRTLAALEAAEAEIERLYVLCDWWAKEEGLQRQRAEKAEAELREYRNALGNPQRNYVRECNEALAAKDAEIARLRELCGSVADCVEKHDGRVGVMDHARLRAAAEGKGAGT